MEEVISVALPEAPTLAKVVLYVVTKSGQYLNKSQAEWLVASQQVILSGEVVTKAHQVLDLGIHILEVRGRSYPIDIKPVFFE